MVEPDNLTLVLLREMWAEMNARFDGQDSRFERIEKRLDTMQANGVLALRSFYGHRTMMERTIWSFVEELREIKERLDRLERAPV